MKLRPGRKPMTPAQRFRSSTHVHRFLRSVGREETIAGESIPDYFWARVDVRGPDDCWPWKLGTQSRGYGSFGVTYKKRGKKRGKTFLAHRTALELSGAKFVGVKLESLHSCHFKRCCNPKHLRFGTSLENSADDIKDGKTMTCEKNGRARLTRAQVREICRLRFRMGRTSDSLAEEFGVASKYVGDLCAGRNRAADTYDIRYEAHRVRAKSSRNQLLSTGFGDFR